MNLIWQKKKKSWELIKNFSFELSSQTFFSMTQDRDNGSWGSK